MKNISVVLGVLALWGCGDQELQVPEGNDLGPQAGLEDLALPGVALISDPGAWSTKPSGVSLGETNQLYELGTTQEIAHAGGASAFIRSLPAAATHREAWGTFKEGTSAAPFVGKRLRMKGWVKTTNTIYAAMWFAVDAAGNKNIAVDNMSDRPIAGTTDWMYYEDVLDVPAAAANLRFGLLVVGTGSAYIDDVTFEIVDLSVPTTATVNAP